MRIRRRFRFEAAHVLPKHPGRCRELHGHGYELVVTVRRPVDRQSGMVMDFAELKAIVQERVLKPLDHSYLNDTMANPTAEEIARWIWGALAPALEGLEEVELFETPDCAAVYRGEDG